MRRASLLLALLCALARTAVALPGPAQGSALWSPLPRAVDEAIDRGVARLLALQAPDGSFRPSPGDPTRHHVTFPDGYTALVLYTLLESGAPPATPAVRRALAHLSDRPPRKTYSAAVQVLALDALRDPEQAPRIRALATWIAAAHDDRTGLWGYPDKSPDLSNTHFAVLALAAALRHGWTDDPRTWSDLVRGVTRLQTRAGGFRYAEDHEATGTMTAAGVAVLYRALERLDAADAFRADRQAAERALAAAWTWLDRNWAPTGNPYGPHGRLAVRHPTVGGAFFQHHAFLWWADAAASLVGRARIGGRDAYREGAVQLLRSEAPAGGWGSLEDTCFALLFLRRATFSGPGAAEPAAIAGTAEATPERPDVAEPAQPAAPMGWRYTTRRPSADDGWIAPGYDDAGWAEGPGPFGAPGAARQDAAPAARTPWTTGEIWLRRAVELERPPDLRLFVAYHESARVYLNGVLAWRWRGGAERHAEIPISAEARAALRPGRNVIAAYAARGRAERGWIDVLLDERGGAPSGVAELEPAERGHGETRPPGDPGAAGHWWLAPPREGPFVRRWLVLGPFANEDDALLHDSLLPDEAADPEAGDRDRGRTWTEIVSECGLLDLERHTRATDHTLSYAFTRLVVEREVETVLWLGCDDGARVHLDGQLVFSHHGDQPAVPDAFPVPLRLSPGVHRLLVEVDETESSTGFVARFGRVDGTPATEVLPVLARDGADRARAALAHPELFALDELARLLPLDRKRRRTFARPADLEGFAFGPVATHTPRLAREPVEGVAGPAPGARGGLAIGPAGPHTPARVLWRVALDRPRRLELTACAESVVAPGRARTRLAIGVHADGELAWLLDELLASSAEPSRDDWRELAVDLAPWAGREVLVVLRVSAPEDDELHPLFLDELRLR